MAGSIDRLIRQIVLDTMQTVVAGALTNMESEHDEDAGHATHALSALLDETEAQRNPQGYRQSRTPEGLSPDWSREDDLGLCLQTSAPTGDPILRQ
jgi:hypothetical protein